MANRINDIATDEEIVALVDYENMTYQEIGDKLGFHKKTIGRHYRAGKEKIEEMPFETGTCRVLTDKEIKNILESGEEKQTWWDKFLDFFKIF